MKHRRPPNMEEQVKRAFEACRMAHNKLTAMISLYKQGSCKIEALKPFLDLCQQVDKEYMTKQAIMRSEWIQNSPPDDYDKTLDQGIEQNRLVALQYLKEQCNIKI